MGACNRRYAIGKEFQCIRQANTLKKIKFLQLATYHMVEEVAPLWSSGYLDPGWENGIAQDERKKKVKCKYCRKMVSGGIFRLKQCLVRLTGEVTHCEKVPEDVCLSTRKNLEGCHSVRK